MSKQQLRKLVRERLDNLTKKSIEIQSDNVYTTILNLNQFHNSNNIALYMSMDKEIDTNKLLQKAFDLKKSVFIPRVNGDVMNMIKINDTKNLIKNKFGIWEPSNSADVNTPDYSLDLIIVPALAFDNLGNRLGHGKGYYDKYFESYEQKYNSIPLLVGIAFDEQLVDNVPVTDSDVKMDMVVVNEKIYKC